MKELTKLLFFFFKLSLGKEWDSLRKPCSIVFCFIAWSQFHVPQSEKLLSGNLACLCSCYLSLHSSVYPLLQMQWAGPCQIHSGTVFFCISQADRKHHVHVLLPHLGWILSFHRRPALSHLMPDYDKCTIWVAYCLFFSLFLKKLPWLERFPLTVTRIGLSILVPGLRRCSVIVTTLLVLACLFSFFISLQPQCLKQRFCFENLNFH